MSSSSGVWLGLGGLLVIAACSSSSQPAVDGTCTGKNCANGGSGGGSTGSGSGSASSDAGDDAAGACGVSSAQSQCDQCAGNECCSDLETCGNNLTCENLLSCWQYCATASCQTSCKQQYPTAVSTFDALLSCLSDRCTVCSELGVGDPCSTSGTACNAGLTCGGLFCTRICLQASDCTGLGANGGNILGNASVCKHITSGNYCFPGCASDSDCSDFPGTYCVQTTAINGAAVSICENGPDGGLD
jgi:hypothetical protein